MREAVCVPGRLPRLAISNPEATAEKACSRPKMGLKEIKAQRRAEAEARKAEAAGRRARERRVAELETQIQTLEARQRELAALMEEQATTTIPPLRCASIAICADVGDSSKRPTPSGSHWLPSARRKLLCSNFANTSGMSCRRAASSDTPVLDMSTKP
jgi:Tfp pilus assembly protein FimV